MMWKLFEKNAKERDVEYLEDRLKELRKWYFELYESHYRLLDHLGIREVEVRADKKLVKKYE